MPVKLTYTNPFDFKVHCIEDKALKSQALTPAKKSQEMQVDTEPSEMNGPFTLFKMALTHCPPPQQSLTQST